jgi:hypothetical protein
MLPGAVPGKEKTRARLATLASNKSSNIESLAYTCTYAAQLPFYDVDRRGVDFNSVMRRRLFMPLGTLPSH